jgi:hypothetical protein
MDSVERQELSFKTFGIPGTILGDYDELKTRELIESVLGDIPDQLRTYLYKFLQTKKKKDVIIDLLRYVGVTGISMTLSALGLGPLSSLFKGFLPTEDNNSLNIEGIESAITDSLYKDRFLTLSMNMNLNLQKIKYFMATVYLPLKIKYYASCNFDENSGETIDIIRCLEDSNYDPNIVKKDPYENETKRNILNETLKEMERLLYSECSSLFSDIKQVSKEYKFGNSIEIAKLINNITVQLNLIEISYYQEKSLVDNLHRDSKVINNINDKIKKSLDNLVTDPGKQTEKSELLNMILPSCKSLN